MAHHRNDVIAHAVTLLDTHGLAALTMRRLGAELDVQPSAIYHHFANKQTLLAAVADDILSRRCPPTGSGWEQRLRQICAELRRVMLGCTDGADVVATVWAFGLGAQAPAVELETVVSQAGADPLLSMVASRTLLNYVFGHCFEEQTARQAINLGAVERSLESLPDFDLGLDLVIRGLKSRLEA